MKPISQTNVIRTYRFYAPFYNRLFGAVLEPGRHALAEAECSLRPASVLEVGVGTGLTLCRYPPSSFVIDIDIDIDISTEILHIAGLRVGQLTGRDFHFQAMDAEAMDFPDNCFDCVTIPYVLSVTPDPQRLVAEIRRVCRNDGATLILNHFSGSRFWWFPEQAAQFVATRIGFRSDFSFADQILKYDWEVRSVRTVNFPGLSKLVEIRNV